MPTPAPSKTVPVSAPVAPTIGAKPAPQAAPSTVKPAEAPARPSANDDLEATFGPKQPSTTPETPKPAEPKPEAPDASKAPPEPKDDPLVDSGNEYLIDAAASPEKPDAAKASEPVKDVEIAFKGAPELRKAYGNLKIRFADLEKQLSEIKAKPTEDSERKVFTEQISTLNKKLEEATGALKFVAWEQSDEYKGKYETPFVESWNEGVQQVSSLNVTNEAGEIRKGTADDFQAVMRESDNARAAEIASELFGANSFYVLSKRVELQRLNNSRNKALSEYRATVDQRTKAEQEASERAKTEAENQRIQRITNFKKFNDEAATKYPDLFAPLQGDEEGNRILEKGYKDADLAFAGGNGLSPEQLVRLHSAIRNRAAAFGRLTLRLAKKEAKIAELEAAAKDLRESTPGPGQVSREDGSPKELSAMEELEALASRS